ncbi:YcbK family protein [Nitrosomonas marina]|uniref:Murein endopeptidase K n=1 Tax=Nitrosomonas marina TaxID=917 RepID=A0A1H8AG98_9PROT|nr:YcbK family protein [Nitrosomonas marina]SEM68964.1 Uncharacterized conserved protein YcbK, DUF882 family [Nitrosomonas marina]
MSTSLHSHSRDHSDSVRIFNKKKYGRRHFLKAGIGACTLLALPNVQASPLDLNERKLALLNLHTGERVKTTYWAEGQYVSEGLTAIKKVLRDHRTGETYEIDPNLLDMLQLLNYKMRSKKEFHVISGYRSPATNAQLSARSNGVAKRSLHMQGKAIDLRLPGHMLSDLHNAALSLQAGGVGYYPKSDFIHIDTGHVRQWRG